jgi:hypothetical protein
MVQPLCVIHHAHQRALFSYLGQQAQQRQANQEPIGRRARLEAERGPERIALWARQMPEAIKHRPAQLVKPGEGELHLRLHSHRPQNS